MVAFYMRNQKFPFHSAFIEIVIHLPIMVYYGCGIVS